jgi:hypothetical protein
VDNPANIDAEALVVLAGANYQWSGLHDGFLLKARADRRENVISLEDLRDHNLASRKTDPNQPTNAERQSGLRWLAECIKANN